MIGQNIKKVSSIYRKDGFKGVRQKIGKKAGNFVRTLMKDTVVNSPESFMIEMTNLCNLRCTTCAREYGYGQEMHKGSIDLDAFKRIIDEISPTATSVGLTGLGETLIYKRLPEALDYVQSKIDNPNTFISTNANLPNTPELMERIHKQVNTVQISIDGVRETYDEIRRKASYSRFLENVKQIAGLRGPSFVFNMVVMRQNYHEMKDVIEVAHDTGITRVQFNTFNLASVTTGDVKDYELYRSPEFLHELKEAAATASRLGIAFKSFFDFETDPGFKKCPYPWTSFYITWDGYLVPCCTKPFPLEMNFGNVFEVGVMNCLNSEKFKEFRRQWQKNEAPQFCNRCHLVTLPKVDLKMAI